MMDSLISDSITLLVKSPAANIRDQHVEARLDWTVEKLKGHLESVYPNKPKSQWQKLIYCGRLLGDRLLLRDIFRHLSEGEVHTVHLVCSTLANSVCKEIPALGSEPSRVRYRAAAAAVNKVEEEQDEGSSAAASSDGPAQPRPPQQEPAGSAESAASVEPQLAGAAAGYSPEYIQTVQNMYAYYWQQMAAWNAFSLYQQQQQYGAAGVPPPQFVPPTQHGTPAAAAGPAQENQQQQPAQPAGAAQQQQQQAGARNNDNIVLDAQGRVMMDDGEDGEVNDWLDWVYIACRLAVILSIIYFYSSMGRFIMVSAVVGLIFVMYMLRRDWQQEAQARNDMVAAGANQQAAAAALPAQGGEDQQPGGGEGESQGNENPPAAALPPRPPTIMETLATFFYNFFASLVPDLPQAI